PPGPPGEWHTPPFPPLGKGRDLSPFVRGEKARPFPPLRRGGQGGWHEPGCHGAVPRLPHRGFAGARSTAASVVVVRVQWESDHDRFAGMRPALLEQGRHTG